jgi:hypothetical protein
MVPFATIPNDLSGVHLLPHIKLDYSTHLLRRALLPRATLHHIVPPIPGSIQ